MDVFNWSIDLSGFTETTEYPVNTISFGDGYEQRQPIGLAPPKRSWNVQKTAYKTEIESIKAFLDARAGVQAFLMPLCHDKKVKVLATEVNKSALGAGYYTLSWKLKETR